MSCAGSFEMCWLRAVEVAARRLDEAMAELRAGREVQPGKLIALSRLRAHGHDVTSLRYFVLDDAAKCLMEGRSLALCHGLPIDEKLALFRRALAIEDAGCARAEREAESRAIRTYLLERFPDTTRRHVHGIRWKQPDSDLLLLGELFSTNPGYSWPFALTAYCIDYARYRWMLAPCSLSRLAALRGWLDDRFPLRDGVRTFAGLPPQEYGGAYCSLNLADRDA